MGWVDKIGLDWDMLLCHIEILCEDTTTNHLETVFV